jgi:hypothetical protein
MSRLGGAFIKGLDKFIQYAATMTAAVRIVKLVTEEQELILSQQSPRFKEYP